ncbi:MAG: DUF2892 domain-containing protein [Actinomycetota bacterium]|nr:DUF2892 domain-containing protein [Actinomycetota bacterium]
MRNVGGADKILRIILGIVLALVGALAGMAGGVRIILFIVAAVALFTGIFGF